MQQGNGGHSVDGCHSGRAAGSMQRAETGSAARRLVGRGANDDRSAVVPRHVHHRVVDRPERQQTLSSQSNYRRVRTEPGTARLLRGHDRGVLGLNSAGSSPIGGRARHEHSEAGDEGNYKDRTNKACKGVFPKRKRPSNRSRHRRRHNDSRAERTAGPAKFRIVSVSRTALLQVSLCRHTRRLRAAALGAKYGGGVC